MTGYAELLCLTNFSFLRGASHAEELVATARALGLDALGVCDINTLAGVVRAHLAAKEQGMRLLVGARLRPSDGPALVCYPTDRAAYGRLSRLLSQGKTGQAVGDVPKGECHITVADIIEHAEGQIFIAVPPDVPGPDFEPLLTRLAGLWGDRLYLAAVHRMAGGDRARLGALEALSGRTGVPLVASQDVLYHTPARRPLPPRPRPRRPSSTTRGPIRGAPAPTCLKVAR